MSPELQAKLEELRLKEQETGSVAVADEIEKLLLGTPQCLVHHEDLICPSCWE
jgi:hypothetical protein